MLIVIDKRISPEAKEKLAAYGDLLELETRGITYPAISGHPDIFFCPSPQQLFVAPNLPERYFAILDQHQVEYIKGELPVGRVYPASARYNAVATDNHLIHNFRHTDPVIRDSFSTDRDSVPVACLSNLICIHVEQGYTRCNLLPLRDWRFITSDKGIYSALEGLRPGSQGLRPSVIYINPLEIRLEGFPHGFFGGCCGVFENKVFINGNLQHLPEGEEVRKYLEDLDYGIVELHDGPLADHGGIFFFSV